MSSVSGSEHTGLREQLGGKNDVGFQDTRTEGSELDTSIEQGWKDIQAFCMLRLLCLKWKQQKMGYQIKEEDLAMLEMGCDLVRRADRQGEVSIWCRKCSGHARQKMGPKIAELLQARASWHQRTW